MELLSGVCTGRSSQAACVRQADDQRTSSRSQASSSASSRPTIVPSAAWPAS
eukprot:COSAG01_NODE_5484_length_4230_cov_12.160252_7_plen_51_part_01